MDADLHRLADPSPDSMILWMRSCEKASQELTLI